VNLELVRSIADAVLYEGYMLYPYRPSSVKNRQRWTFGGLYPEAYASHGDSSTLLTEVLIEGGVDPALEVRVRFLHLMVRGDGVQEAMEREVCPGRFEFPATQHDGRRQEAIEGLVEVSVQRVAPDLHKASVRVTNTGSVPPGASRDEALLRALVSTHAILQTSQGGLVSLTDPPEQFAQAAKSCSNTGVWPVLVGEEGSRDCMLASPIILYDYPRIAPESAGNLFDGCEIDEILTLRIMTMTDAEKQEMRTVDEHTRRVLDRTESLSSEQMMKLHGVLRNPHVAASEI
jgi:hypothetical protein